MIVITTSFAPCAVVDAVMMNHTFLDFVIGGHANKKYQRLNIFESEEGNALNLEILKGKIRKSPLYGPVSNIKTFLKEIPYSLLRIVFSCFPIEEKKVVIDRPKSREPALVTAALIKNGGYDIVWACAPSITLPEGVRSVRTGSVQYVYELMTARIWIDNARKKNWVKKRKGQLYIQTWHGPVCIKMIEKDAISDLIPSYVTKAKNDSKNADYIVAETAFMEKIMKSSFWYNGPIIRAEFKDQKSVGPEKRQQILHELGISEDCKIVLYAPTFRKNENVDCYDLDYKKLIADLNAWDSAKKWKIIIRLHPNIEKKINFIAYDNDVVNGTLYSMLDELVAISDVLITDYSSCLFYGFRAQKRVFIYASDFDRYTKEERGAYFDYTALPSPLAKNYDELIKNIKTLDTEEYEKERISLVTEIGYYGTDACLQIVKIINGGSF